MIGRVVATPQAHTVGADHPLAMAHNILAADVEVRLREADEEHDREQRGCRGFVGSADVHLEAHDQRGCPDDQAADQQNWSRPAMKLQMFLAKALCELKWREAEKQSSWQNVQKG